jgi:isoprenylcysteine carboxyl methyltransferase (ICMT) family protein YpbQ
MTNSVLLVVIVQRMCAEKKKTSKKDKEIPLFGAQAYKCLNVRTFTVYHLLALLGFSLSCCFLNE